MQKEGLEAARQLVRLLTEGGRACPAVLARRTKSCQSSLPEWVGVHLHEPRNKERGVHDRSTPVWILNPVRRWNADEDKKGGRNKDDGAGTPGLILR
jgi:hypothetical protein